MKRKITLLTLCITLFALCSSVEAQQAKVYRVGVIHQGGPYKAVVDGLRDGLRQLGYEEGNRFSWRSAIQRVIRSSLRKPQRLSNGKESI